VAGFLSQYGILLIASSLVGLMILERFFSLRRWTRPALPRLIANAVTSAITFAVAAFLVKPVAQACLQWSNHRSFGLLAVLKLPVIVEFIAGFLLLDLTFYYWHRINHRIPFLWRFHNVHHYDPDLDASTGFRFHFGEVAMSVFFRATQALVLGVSFSTFVIYEFVFQLWTYFHHSNLRLPGWLDGMLSFAVVTPRMHGIHHSQVRAETDSNFSVVFNFWDRLHRTLKSNKPQSEIVIGVPAYSRDSDNEVGNILLSPFRRQRPYWTNH
jgi:sterol desaturase/sphingolipid hydroxylase (fatty acid hydroxylase superfamily)